MNINEVDEKLRLSGINLVGANFGKGTPLRWTPGSFSHSRWGFPSHSTVLPAKNRSAYTNSKSLHICLDTVVFS